MKHSRTYSFSDCLRRAQHNAIYENSVPIPENHPSGIVKNMHTLCERVGIAFPPEMRVFTGEFLSGTGCALVSHNAVILGSDFLRSASREEMEGTSAHEIGHLVFADNDNFSRQQERRADRFSHFFTGNPSGFIQAITALHEENLRTIAEAKRNGRELESDERSHCLYGDTGDRIEQLQKPITGEEKRRFQKAIESYNRRMKVKRELSSSDGDRQTSEYIQSIEKMMRDALKPQGQAR